MKKFKTIYVCDNCGYENDDSLLFRELYGNVVIPETDIMLVGNNIWNKTNIPENVQNAIKQKMMPICHNSDDTVVSGMTFCLKCYIKMALSSYNNANSVKEEKEILTSILSEISGIAVKSKKDNAQKTVATENNSTFELTSETHETT